MKSFSDINPLSIEGLSPKERLDFFYNLAHSESTDPELLRTLSQEESLDVRWAVALNKSTPEDVLLKMATDLEEHHNVLFALSWNVSLPKEAAQALLDNGVFLDSVTGTSKHIRLLHRLEERTGEA